MKKNFLFLFLLLPLLAASSGQNLDSLVNKEYPSLDELYKYLHSHPELSYFENNTSVKIAKELRNAGYEVTDHFGKYQDPTLTSYGIVAVLKNGQGPRVLVRTDMDALPVEEKTGLPYASQTKTKDHEGQDVSVMHACGHDIHMSVFVGTARALMALKNQWKGTLILIGQPAEEIAPGGAEAMLRGGLYEKFGKPDYCLGFHDDAELETGKVGWTSGYTNAAADSVDITIRGLGGHGAYPHKTKDPIVIASEVVLALQTIVSREVPPGEMGVVTVGAIHGGTKNNIIPDEVKLLLTVRSYKKEVRDLLLNSIQRIAKGIAIAAGVPADRMPIVDLHPEKYVPATYNNPALTKRMVPVFQTLFGSEKVVEEAPVGGAEDFSRYSLEDHSIPALDFRIGAVSAEKIKESRESGKPLPSLHSSLFAPVPESTIKTGVKAMTVAVLDLMKR